MAIPYIIKNWRGGISDEVDKGIIGAFKHGHAIAVHKRRDSLSANQAMLTVNSPSELPRYFVASGKTGSTYAFCHEGSILERTAEGAWQSVYTAPSGIRGAAEFSHDDGTTYMYWAIATSLSRRPMNGSETIPWADVVNDYKTTLEDVADHTMGVAAGQLNIANGPFLATQTFAQVFDAQELNIRPGNLIRTIEERDDYVVLGSKKKDDSEEGHIWDWLVFAENWLHKKKIPAKGVNAFIYAELPLMQVGSDGEIFFSDFVDVTPLNALDGGGQANPGGVSIFQDLAIFGFYGGTFPGLWSFGRKRKNRPHVLNFEYRVKPTVDGSTVTEIGAVKTAGGTLLASWATTDGSTVDYGIDQVSTTTKADALYEGLEFSAGTPQMRKTFMGTKVTMEPLPSSTTIALKYRTNRLATGGDSSAGAGFKYAKVGSSSATTFTETNQTEAEFIINDNGRVTEIGMELVSSLNTTPEVTAITTDLEDNSERF